MLFSNNGDGDIVTANETSAYNQTLIAAARDHAHVQNTCNLCYIVVNNFDIVESTILIVELTIIIVELTIFIVELTIFI